MSRSNTDSIHAVRQIAKQFTGLPDGIGRYQIVNALKAVGSRLGFNRRHIAYIELMIAFTKETDWKNGDCLPMVWLSVEEIALKLCVTTRQVNRIEQSLVLLGAIYLHDYGNFRRRGKRNSDGSVRYAFGVDLRPLAVLWEELAYLTDLAKRENEEWREVRYEVSSLRRQIGDTLRSGNPVIADLIDQIETDEAFCCRIKRADPFGRLVAIRDRLQDWLDTLEKTIVDNSLSESSLQGKMSDKQASNVRHHKIHTTMEAVESDSREEVPTERDRPCTPQVQAGGRIAFSKRQEKKCGKGRGSPPRLRKILEAVSPRLRELLIDHNNQDLTNASIERLIEACKQLVPMLGVSSSLWREAVGHFNPYGVCMVLIVIDARHYAGEVLSPGGLLRAMIERDKNGELNINASLHGLVDRAMREMREEV